MEELVKPKSIFNLLSELVSQMSSILNVDELVIFVVSELAEIFESERVSFMLLDETKQELSIKASHGLNPPADSAKIKLGEMFGGWVAQQGKPLLVKDIAAEFPDLSKDRLLRYKTKSFVIVPIKMKEGVIGILSLTDRRDMGIFTEDDLRVVNFLCHCLAMQIENIKLFEENANLVTIDNLTRLFNHRYFQEQLLEEIYRAERNRQPLSLLMLDIDDFCWYNQTYSYSAGDSALKQIGKIIKENTRRIDVAVRYGPEEFMIILPNTRLKQAIFVGEKIKETIGYSVFAEDRSTSLGMARLTVSVGAVEHKNGLNKEELIRCVANALLDAKANGKNRVCAIK